jgi:pyruvate dehydrogenase E2 component (dihydrolipoamide acetyltransferase)
VTDVLMPRLSDSMEQGTILTWLVQDGGEVAEGQELAEIETDKATMTYEAEAGGTLAVVVAAGTTVAVGEVIARVGDRAGGAAQEAGAAGEPEAVGDPQAAGEPEADAAQVAREPEADAAQVAREPEAEAEAAQASLAGEANVVAAQASPAAKAVPAAQASPAAKAVPAADVAEPEPAAANGRAGHPTQPMVPLDAQVAATPMARRIAARHDVSLGSLQGSGPRGRIVRADVLRAAGVEEANPAAPASATPTPAAGPQPPAAGPQPPAAGPQAPAAGPQAAAPAPSAPPPLDGDTRVEPTRLQALIARRMAESKATIPHFQVQTEVEMSAALAFRKELKALAAARDIPAPSLNDLIVKASALALRRFPRANGSYADGGFVLHGAVNVGIAVASEDALVVPVLHGADGLTLGEIAVRTRRLAAAVRDGTVTPPQLSGGTFTVSNLGMYGMTAITPVVNPPQAAILGVGAIRELLARDADGTIVDRRLLTLTLSCDHRILYGADAARFLAAIRELLQQPAGLAL